MLCYSITPHFLKYLHTVKHQPEFRTSSETVTKVIIIITFNYVNKQ